MTPYFSSKINDTVRNIDEHRMLEAMMNRSAQQIEKYATELDIRGMADDNLRNSRMYQFAQKCIEARRLALEEERIDKIFAESEGGLDLSFDDEECRVVRQENHRSSSQPMFNINGFWNPLSAFVTTVVTWNAGWYLGEKFADMLGAANQEEVDRILGKK